MMVVTTGGVSHTNMYTTRSSPFPYLLSLKWISVALLLLLMMLPLAASSSSAPWQQRHTKANVQDEQLFKNLPPTVFSSNGRLYSVERMVEAASNPEDASSNLVVAVVYQDGVVVVSTRARSPHLDTNVTMMLSNTTKSSSTTKKKNVTLVLESPRNPRVGPQVYALTGGNAADSQILRDKILQISEMLWQSNGGLGGDTVPVPPFVLARHVADHLQRPTQQMSSGKILASQALVWDASSVWRVDPSGQFWKCRAAAIGRSRYKVEAKLEENYTNNKALLTRKQAIALLVDSVKDVVVGDQERLEGMIVTKSQPSRVIPLTHDMLVAIATKEEKKREASR